MSIKGGVYSTGFYYSGGLVGKSFKGDVYYTGSLFWGISIIGELLKFICYWSRLLLGVLLFWPIIGPLY